MPRQALTSERPIEGFADRVIDRFAGPTEVEQHAIPVGPMVEGRRDELRSVVALNDRRQPAGPISRVAQQARDIRSAERLRHLERDALARVDVDEREDAHGLPGGQDVVHEVHGPSLVRSADLSARQAHGGGAPPPPAWFELKLILQVQWRTFLRLMTRPSRRSMVWRRLTPKAGRSFASSCRRRRTGLSSGLTDW